MKKLDYLANLILSLDNYKREKAQFSIVSSSECTCSPPHSHCIICYIVHIDK